MVSTLFCFSGCSLEQAEEISDVKVNFDPTSKRVKKVRNICDNAKKNGFKALKKSYRQKKIITIPSSGENPEEMKFVDIADEYDYQAELAYELYLMHEAYQDFYRYDDWYDWNDDDWG